MIKLQHSEYVHTCLRKKRIQRWSRLIAPQARIWGAYSGNKAYRTSFCTFRGWILYSTDQFRKYRKLGKKKRKLVNRNLKKGKLLKRRDGKERKRKRSFLGVTRGLGCFIFSGGYCTVSKILTRNMDKENCIEKKRGPNLDWVKQKVEFYNESYWETTKSHYVKLSTSLESTMVTNCLLKPYANTFRNVDYVIMRQYRDHICCHVMCSVERDGLTCIRTGT